MEQRQFDHQEMLRSVSPDVPAMPFTLPAFRAHLARRGAEVTDVDAAAQLMRLTASGALLKLGPNIEMWIGTADLDTAIDRLDAAAHRRSAACRQRPVMRARRTHRRSTPD